MTGPAFDTAASVRVKSPGIEANCFASRVLWPPSCQRSGESCQVRQANIWAERYLVSLCRAVLLRNMILPRPEVWYWRIGAITITSSYRGAYARGRLRGMAIAWGSMAGSQGVHLRSVKDCRSPMTVPICSLMR